jgi:hypothetical protein|tara:strand:- start:168 stop:449 length:282 start_codon:yes stop_codon:yes gene_type:complete
MEAKDFLSDRFNGSTKSLFKNFLVIIEDLHAENEISFAKLKRALPEHSSLIDQANYLDAPKMQHLRKKILDLGNESIRGSNSDLEKFTIKFNF